MSSLAARRRPLTTVTIGAALAAVALAGCGKSETSSSPSSAPASSGGGAQQLASSTPAPSSTGSAAPAAAGCTLAAYGAKPGLKLQGLTVGFSQSEKEANPFRIAETASIKAEGARLGAKVIATNAQSTLSKQIADIQDLITQGAQALIVAPLNSTGLEPALKSARDKNIPVITVDRQLTGATTCKDYLTFIGSNFVQQGQRAAKLMVDATGGKGKIAILLGSSGNNVTTDRTSGFLEGIKAAPGLQVVAQQTGDFTRQQGQQVTEQFLQSQPGLTAIYAENDEMALGAVTALKSAGKTPGKEVKVISVDGTQNAVKQVVSGSINGVIESNPRFGPLAFDTLQKFLGGQAVPPKLIISDKQYDTSNAAAEVGSAY